MTTMILEQSGALWVQFGPKKQLGGVAKWEEGEEEQGRKRRFTAIAAL